MVSRSSVLVTVLLVLATASRQANAVTCGQAVSRLAPCLNYLTGRESSITAVCCGAAIYLNDLAKSKDDIKTLCNCLKQTANALKIDAGKAKSIPQICNIRTPVPIDPNVDCSNL